MNDALKQKLTSIAEERQVKDDPSHDFQHIRRVTNLAIKIAVIVGADLDIVVPAALFHDIVVYAKNTAASKNEAHESAEVAAQLLSDIPEYPYEKIEKVKTCIMQCSFSKGIVPDLLEAKVLQDADRLEATGAISIMRTFASAGQMNTPLYPVEDPLCEKSAVNFRSGIDLFFNRLLIVEKTMHTDIARTIARERTEFLHRFLQQFKIELQDADMI